MNSTAPVLPAEPWLEVFRRTTDWWAHVFLGVDQEKHRRQTAAAEASAEALRRITLQSQVDGCRKTRSERWNHAHFLRWIEYHAAAFDVVYGKLTPKINAGAARSFLRNFHYVEYLLAKRHHILMEEWGQKHREKLCDLIKQHDRYFSIVRRFHRLNRKRHCKFMEELSGMFSTYFSVDE